MLLRVVAIALGALAALALLVWVGLLVAPAPFPAFPQQSSAPTSMPLPEGLPAPVERFYRQLYGDSVPVIESAVITGRARMRPAGPLYLPVRFRFAHIAGQDYRHFIEATWFGIPVLRINERYVGGVSRFEFPGGVVEDDPEQNQGANLGLWAESIWLPSVWITDPRVRWEPVDEVTAILVVPFEEGEERLVVRFDPDSGLIAYMESMRYQGADATSKTLWLNESTAWAEVGGSLTLREAALIWINQREPWAMFVVEDVVYNIDVQDYMLQRGP